MCNMDTSAAPDDDTSTAHNDDASTPLIGAVHISKPRILRYFIAAGFLYYLAVTLTLASRPALILNAAPDAPKAALFTGVVDATQAVVHTVTAPLLGSFADDVGRVPILALCFVVEGLALLLVGLLRASLVGQLAGYFLAAASDAALVICYAAIADLAVDNDTSTRGYALFGSAKGTAIFIGPLLGGVLSTKALSAPLFISGIGLMLTLPFIVRIPEPRPSAALPPVTSSSLWSVAGNVKVQNPFNKIRTSLTRSRALMLLSAGYATFQWAQAGIISIMYLYSNAVAGWESLTYGAYISATGITLIVTQAFIAAPLTRLVGERRFVVAGLVGLVAHNLWLAQVNAGWGIWVSILFRVPSFASLPAMMAAFARQVESEEQGALQGALSAVATVCKPPSVLAFATTFAFCQQLGYPGAAFYLTAVLHAISAFLFYLGFVHHDLK